MEAIKRDESNQTIKAKYILKGKKKLTSSHKNKIYSE